MNTVNENGVLHDQPRMIKQVVVNHFSQLFTEEWRCRPKLSGVLASIRQTDSVNLLESEFLEDEI